MSGEEHKLREIISRLLEDVSFPAGGRVIREPFMHERNVSDDDAHVYI